MAGTELFGNEERKEVLDVLETGILFRYNHDSQRNGVWKAKTFEQEFSSYLGASAHGRRANFWRGGVRQSSDHFANGVAIGGAHAQLPSTGNP